MVTSAEEAELLISIAVGAFADVTAEQGEAWLLEHRAIFASPPAAQPMDAQEVGGRR